MKKNLCAAFLFDGFADHELSLVMAALKQSGDYKLETFSTRGQAVTASSGLRVLPDASLALVSPDDFDLLLLPGGEQWEKGDILEIFPLLEATLGRRLIIAVGSAILALADLGWLDSLPHTGKDPGYFQRLCPDYAGQTFFRKEPWVNAGIVLTIDGEALSQPTAGILGVFDTLQEIYLNDHELFDPAC